MPSDNQKLLDFTYTASSTRSDLEWILLNLETEVDTMLGRVEIEIEKQKRLGYKKADIEKFIETAIGTDSDFMKGLNNHVDKVIDDLTNQMVAKPVYEFDRQNPGLIYDWVLGSVKTSHCADCLWLSSLPPRTITEWRKLGKGLPAEGKTICKQGCRCQMALAGEQGKEGQKPVELEPPTDKGGMPKAPKVDKFVPAKTIQEAEEWSKNSAIKETVYHGTSNKAAEKIMREGFNWDETTSGKFYGDGAYFAFGGKQSPFRKSEGERFADMFSEIAEGTAKGLTDQQRRESPLLGKTLKCKINVNKVYDLTKETDRWYKFEDIVEEYIYGKDAKVKITSKDITKYLTDNGYDAIQLIESYGGDHKILVVLDKTKISVIKD